MSKVARLIEEWDLDGVGDQLESYWLGNGNEQRSLRSLSDWFNQQLLAAVLDSVGESYVEKEVENIYELLTDDEISSGMQIEIERRLEQQGIDVEQLQQSFVSHQSIYTYLTKYRGVSQPEIDESDAERIKKTSDTIQRLVNRTQAVVSNNLETLNDTGRITVGSFNVFVDVQVFCQDCENQYTIDELLSNNGCDCNTAESQR